MLHEATSGHARAGEEPLHVLLVEDDDGDALLVEELLAEADLYPDLTRAWSLEAALDALAVPVDCVLLDLGLPDASGLDALVRLREVSDAALVVLTGLDDAERGVRAVAAGAQDYLVKGTVGGEALGRAIRFAVERRRAERARRDDGPAALTDGTSRLERGLLAGPELPAGAVRVTVRHDGAGGRSDLSDAVRRPDGTVAALLADVSAAGQEAATLGASLRISWRALVLAGLPAGDVLRSLDGLVRAEHLDGGCTAAAVMVEVDAASRRARVHVAGHPAPLLLGADGAVPVEVAGPALGAGEGAWPVAEVPLEPDGRLALVSCGLVGARSSEGEPLGLRRLRDLLAEGARTTGDDAELAESLLRAARRYAAASTEELAVVLVGWDPR
ncbi:PP2C family protein-serine/threonine phosphatase [Georgenia wangjunii]|uniref:PP2C family protein-serine/threonine phosphatase n=1 Tax=Georgenia wangjunii TaxID=3117730 RepID=UPI002F268E0D